MARAQSDFPNSYVDLPKTRGHGALSGRSRSQWTMRRVLDGACATGVDNHVVDLAVRGGGEGEPKLRAARDAYFNELIVWRELAINFVRYTPNRDSPGCADAWAKATIAEHARDEREHLYTLDQLEEAQTYDDLWNAAQIQMVRHGWMHNYMRMYWAKKILEWTPDVATAMNYAIYLNDKYFLDGRDPNGYTGIAWAILGKFDRAWGERSVFGKSYMSGASTGKKFNSKRYIEQMGLLPEQGSLFSTRWARPDYRIFDSSDARSPDVTLYTTLVDCCAVRRMLD